jgi:hypothetical protein
MSDFALLEEERAAACEVLVRAEKGLKNGVSDHAFDCVVEFRQAALAGEAVYRLCMGLSL